MPKSVCYGILHNQTGLWLTGYNEPVQNCRWWNDREVIIGYSQKLMEVEKYFDDNFQVLINYLELKAELENVKSGD